MSKHIYIPIIYYLAVLLTVWPVMRRYLQFFQQEEYDGRRFLKWCAKTLSFEKRTTLLSILMLLFWIFFLFIPKESWWFEPGLYHNPALIIICLLLTAALAWSNLLRKSKKPLVMTARAKRIFGVSMLLVLVGFYLLTPGILNFWPRYQAIPDLDQMMIYHLCCYFTALIFLLQLSPGLMVLGNIILSPWENRNQKRFLNEALQRLDEYKPTIIGITGSYGKTSVKHILAHILSAHDQTLYTPGSVNTQMGITRIIREKLRRDHRFFIVEMGAYGIGSIQKLCDLTPPDMALVTAVGVAHYERFKTIETVAQAKSELPKALNPNGIAILNGDDKQCRKMADEIEAHAFFYGEKQEIGPLDCWLKQTEIHANGTQCTLVYNDKTYDILLPIHGLHQAHNAAGAFLAAVKLGVPPITAVAALQSVPPIAHRMVVERDSNGVTIIDDAYNSNPVGFKNALNLLRMLEGERKILVTPGMVELGERHEEEHYQIASIAASICDMVCLVAPHRITAMRRGLIESGFSEDNVYEFKTLKEARNWLSHFLRNGDVVLFENDLPDLLELQTAYTLF